MKKIIITADDLGIDKETNQAVKESYENGCLTSSCLLANFSAFDDAVENVVKSFDNFDLGIHLNIIEGKSLTFSGKSLLTDENGVFNNSYIDMLCHSCCEKYMQAVETEFRAQIEKILSTGLKPVYINTHVHTHSIPKMFELVCKLANEYGIKNIRTQAELPYYTKGLSRHTNIHYCLNIVKNILLNTFSFVNKKTAKKYGINTNKYFIGVLYTGQMDKYTMMSGIDRLPKDAVAEIILHPSTNPDKPKHHKEYQALISQELKNYFAQNQTQKTTWQELN